jgi:formate hydrogenlyase regulatory protein HycA
MPRLPKTFPIAHEPDYRTRCIGKCDDGRQFMSFIVAGFSHGKEPWQQRKRWYAVVHTFDGRGNHLGTDARFAGTTADGEDAVIDRATAMLEEMLTGLGSYKLCNVRIKLFSVEIDGIRFGLVDDSYEGRPRVTLWPNDLLFTPPWNGLYST